MTSLPPKKPGASRGVLSQAAPDPTVSDDESLSGAVADRHCGGFAAALAAMPDVGRDSDFERHRDEPLPASELECLSPTPAEPAPVEAMQQDNPHPELLADAPVGREFGAVRILPVSRARRDLTSIIRRGETVVLTKRDRPMAVMEPADAPSASPARMEDADLARSREK